MQKGLLDLSVCEVCLKDKEHCALLISNFPKWCCLLLEGRQTADILMAVVSQTGESGFSLFLIYFRN